MAKRRSGLNSLWNDWRRRLPQGKQIQALATRRMNLWAKASILTLPIPTHSQPNCSTTSWPRMAAVHDAISARSSLLAALLHNIGKSKGDKGTSQDFLRHDPSPWQSAPVKPADLQRAAIVVRFHRGSLPTRSAKAARCPPNKRKPQMHSQPVLRLTNALNITHDGHIRRIQLKIAKSELMIKANGNGAIIIAAEGYSPLKRFAAQTIAAERHLLKTVLHSHHGRPNSGRISPALGEEHRSRRKCKRNSGAHAPPLQLEKDQPLRRDQTSINSVHVCDGESECTSTVLYLGMSGARFLHAGVRGRGRFTSTAAQHQNLPAGCRGESALHSPHLQNPLHADFVSGHKLAAKNADGTFLLNHTTEATLPDVAVSDGFQLQVGEMRITALETPGHTESMLLRNHERREVSSTMCGSNR